MTRPTARSTLVTMAGKARVVVVSVGEAPASLIRELEKKSLEISETTFADAEEEIESKRPDLVVLDGTRGAMELSTLLDDPQRQVRPHLAIVAEGRELARLRGLNRDIVVALLSKEMGERVVVERLDTIAKKWARFREESLAPELPPSPTLSMPPLLDAIPAPPSQAPNFEALADMALDAISSLETNDPPSVAPAPAVTPAAPTPAAPTPAAPAVAPPRPNRTQLGIGTASLRPAVLGAPPPDAPRAPAIQAPAYEAPPQSLAADDLVDDDEIEALDSIAPESIAPESIDEETIDAESVPPDAEAEAPPESIPLVHLKTPNPVDVTLDHAPEEAPVAAPERTASPLFPETASVDVAGASATRDESVRVEASDLILDDDDDATEAPEKEVTRPLADVIATAEANSGRLPAPLPLAPFPTPSATTRPIDATSNSKSSGGKWLALVALLGVGGAVAVATGAVPGLPKNDAPATSPAAKKQPAAPTAATPAAPAEIPAPPAEAPAAPTEASEEAAPSNPFAIVDAKLASCDALLSGVTLTAPDPVQFASTKWRDAREAIVKGDLKRAHQSMCEAVKLHPESAAMEGLALLYVTKSSPAEALGWIERALAVRPNERETLNLKGDALSQQGDSTGALAVWLSALNVRETEMPRRRQVAKDGVTIGRRQLKLGDLPQAERLLRRAATLDPDNTMAFTGLAEICFKTDRLPAARAFATRAIEIFPENPDALLVLGDVARQKNDLETAKAHYTRALGVRPDFWPATMRLREIGGPDAAPTPPTGARPTPTPDVTPTEEEPPAPTPIEPTPVAEP